MQGVACGKVVVNGKDCSYIVEIADGTKSGLHDRFSRIKLTDLQSGKTLASYDCEKWLIKPLDKSVETAIDSLIKRFE